MSDKSPKKDTKKFPNISGIYSQVVRVISSGYFFWVVIAIFALQAMWFATSLQYPMLFDEKFHFEITQAFTDKWTPYLTNESAGIDYYRDLSTRAGLLFHFLMSLPLRLFQFVGLGDIAQFVLLRYINIAAVVCGLVVFRKALLQAKLSKASINIGLLIFALLPMSTYVAATINYDNFIFLLFGLFVLTCVKSVTPARELYIRSFLVMITIGCVASLMKFTFMPIFVAGLALVIFRLTYKRSLITFWHDLTTRVKSFEYANIVNATVVAVCLLSVAMFSSIYVKNLLVYGSPSPSCTATLSREACLKSELENRNTTALETRDERQPMQLADYVLFDWLRSMSSGFSYVVVNSESGISNKDPLPVAYSAITIGLFVAVVILIFGWKYIPRNETMTALLVLSITTVVALLGYNINSYYKYHDIFANQARYLLPIMPLFLSLSVYIANILLSKFKIVKLTMLTMLLLVATQGAGAGAYLIRSETDWFVDRPYVRSFNEKLRSAVEPYVIRYEGGP